MDLPLVEIQKSLGKDSFIEGSQGETVCSCNVKFEKSEMLDSLWVLKCGRIQVGDENLTLTSRLVDYNTMMLDVITWGNRAEQPS